MSTETTQYDQPAQSGVVPVRFSAPESTPDATPGDVLNSAEVRDATRSPFGREGRAAQGE
jgi:hypothetical protein